MNAKSALSNGRPRHFDRGRRLLIGLPAALLLAACSQNLSGNGQPGSAGSSGTGQGGAVGTGGTTGDGGTGGGAAGRGGADEGGRGGDAGTGGGMAGTGGTSFGGTGGGTGGFAGDPMLPVCPSGTPTFSVCIVNDADMPPFPPTASWHDSVIAAAATVEAVGTGAAPAQCADARVFGAATSSDWWVQVRTADKVLWTIGLGGLGNTPLVKAGDPVILDLDYYRLSTMPGPPTPGGHVQLSDDTGTPLLWGGSTTDGLTWLSLAPHQALCERKNGLGCIIIRSDVTATVNGSVATVAPFGAVSLAGYDLAVGPYESGRGSVHTECSFDGPAVFSAAAVKAP